MKIPTLLLSPDESRDRSGVVTLEQSGAVRTVQGQYGKSWFIEEATTNLVPNPTLVTNLSGWVNLNPVTMTAVPSDHPDFLDINMLKVVTPGSVSGEGARVSTTAGDLGLTTTARTFSGQFWFKGTAGQTFYAQAFAWYVTNGVHTYSTTQVNWTASGAWQLIKIPPITSITDGSTLSHTRLDVGRTLTKIASTFYAILPTVEEKPYHTTPTHGSLGAGYAWAGTAHASTSTRAAGVVRTSTVNHFDNRKGAALVRYKLSDFPTGSSRKYMFSAGHDGASYGMLGLRRETATSMFISSFVHGQGTYPTTGLSTATGYHTTYMEWDDAHIGWLEGGIGTINTTTRHKPLEPTPANAVIYVGAYGADSANSEIESIVFFDEPLTQTEREDLAGMAQPWTWDNLMPRVGGTIRTDHSAVSDRTEGVGAYPTSLLTPDGSRDRVGSLTPTTSGALRLVDGPVTETKTVEPLILARHGASQDAGGSLTPVVTPTVKNPVGKFAAGWELAKAKTPAPLAMLGPSDSRDTLGTLPSLYEETTNLFPNPSMETDLAHTSQLYGSVVSRVNTEAYAGSWCAKVVCDGSASSQGIMTPKTTIPAVAGQSFSCSAWIKGAGPLSVIMYGVEAAGSAITESFAVTPTIGDTWQRVVVSGTFTNAATAFVNFRILGPNGVAKTFFVDGIQIEQKPYATGYVDGSFAEGAWTGTAHASTSTRARGSGLTGAVRGLAGQHGSAWLVEEAATNLLYNPSAEVDLNYIFSATPGSTISRDNTTGYVGVASVKTVTTGAGATEGVVYFTPTGVGTMSARTFTGSVYSKGSGTVGSWTRIVYTDGTMISGSSSNVALTASWQRVVTPAVTSDPLKTIDYVQMMTRTVGTLATTFWTDAAQIEEKTYATSYCDGTLGAGYTWGGAAHLSASTRAASSVTLDEASRVNRGSGYAALWFKIDAHTNTTRILWSVGHNATGTDLFELHVAPTNEMTLNVYRGVTHISTTVRSGALSVGTWHLAHVYWDGLTVGIALNQEAFITSTLSGTEGTFNNTTYPMSVGSNRSAGAQLNNPVGPCIVFPRPLTDWERANLYSANSWNWEELNLPDGEVSVGYEATVNECHNPSMETSIAGWAQSGAGVTTITQTNEHAYSGTYSLKAVTDGTTSVQGFYSGMVLTAATGETWTYSGYVRGAGNLRVAVQERDNAGGLLTETVKEIRTLTGKWERFVVTHTHTHASTVRHSLRLTTDAAQAATIYLDAVQIEKKPYATPYADGSLGTDHAWTGTVHLTPSTRAARGSIANTKSYVVRYREGSTDKTAFFKGSALLGTTGSASFSNGSLLITALTSTPILIESVATYDQDMSSVEAELFAINAAWTWGTVTTAVTLPKPAWFIEEGTTNYFIKPLPVSGSKWSQFGVTTHLVPLYAVNTGEVSSHRYVFPTGTAAGNAGFSDYVSHIGWATEHVGKPLTATAVVKGTNLPAGTQVYIRLWVADSNAAALTTVDGPKLNVTGSEQTVSVSIPALPANANRVIAYVWCALGGVQGAGNGIFEMFAAQAELKAYATTITPQTDIVGNLLPSYAWTGTPHASTSTRAFTNVTVPQRINSSKGSVIARVLIDDKILAGYLLSFGNYGPLDRDWLALGWRGGAYDDLFIRAKTGSLAEKYLMSPTGQMAGGTWKTIYYEWDGTRLAGAVNNLPLVVSTRDVPTGNSGADFVRVGYVNGSEVANAALGTTVVFDRPLSEQERTHLLSLDEWDWAEFEQRVSASTRSGFAAPLMAIKQATN